MLYSIKKPVSALWKNWDNEEQACFAVHVNKSYTGWMLLVIELNASSFSKGKGVFTSAPFYREVGAILACNEEATGTGKPFFCHLNR